MKKTHPTQPIFFSGEVNRHLIAFIDRHEKTALPLPFLPGGITSEIFFKDLYSSSFFSEEDCIDPYLKDRLFLGEVLLLISKKDTAIKSKISSIQGSYGLNLQHLHVYSKLRRNFDHIEIGNVINFSLFEPVLYEAGVSISAMTRFDDPEYQMFCRYNPVFAKYNWLHHFEWCRKNHEAILKK